MQVRHSRREGGGRRQSSRLSYQPMTQINITPFVDVMLVLLIIFMVTAPLLTTTIPVDLPSARASPTVPPAQKPLIVTIKAQGSVYLQDSKMTLESLVDYLKTIPGRRADRRVFVRGDRHITYGRVLKVMDAISTTGFTRVALVARLPENGSP